MLPHADSTGCQVERRIKLNSREDFFYVNAQVPARQLSVDIGRGLGDTMLMDSRIPSLPNGQRNSCTAKPRCPAAKGG